MKVLKRLTLGAAAMLMALGTAAMTGEQQGSGSGPGPGGCCTSNETLAVAAAPVARATARIEAFVWDRESGKA